MAAVTLTYMGQTIATLDRQCVKNLKTAGKFCQADILLDYVVRCPGARAAAGFCMKDFFTVYDPETSAAEVISEE